MAPCQKIENLGLVVIEHYTKHGALCNCRGCMAMKLVFLGGQKKGKGWGTTFIEWLCFKKKIPHYDINPYIRDVSKVKENGVI